MKAGTRVLYRDHLNRLIATITRSDVWRLRDGTGVVMLEGLNDIHLASKCTPFTGDPPHEATVLAQRALRPIK